MPRICFDTNIFSGLLSLREQRFIHLNELLADKKERLSFYFSHAHIMDKLKDPSEHKFADFDFIESYTKDNHLSYYLLSKRTHQYLATPLMVYEDNKNGGYSLKNFFSDLNAGTEANVFNSFVENYRAMPVDLNYEAIDTGDDQVKNTLSKLLPMEIASPTVGDVMDK